MEFNSKSIEKLRLGNDVTVSEGDGWTSKVFGKTYKVLLGRPFDVRSDITGETWNAFVNKLLERRRYADAQNKLNEIRKERTNYVASNLGSNIKFNDLNRCVTCLIAEKLTGVFLEELNSAVSGAPLSEFFAVRQSPVTQGVISAFISRRIWSCLESLVGKLRSWTAESHQDCLKLVGGGQIFEGDISKLSVSLALERTSAEFRKKSKKVAVAEFNQLLQRLDATVRKLLAETPFEFVLKFDGSNKAEKSGKMTILEYFEAVAKEWDGEKEDGGSEPNGARLEAAKTDAGAKMEAFLRME
jgi:hypothetical protein